MAKKSNKFNKLYKAQVGIEKNSKEKGYNKSIMAPYNPAIQGLFGVYPTDYLPKPKGISSVPASLSIPSFTPVVIPDRLPTSYDWMSYDVESQIPAAELANLRNYAATSVSQKTADFNNKPTFPNLGVKNIPNPGNNTYFNQNGPSGTITSGDASYAPGTFNLNTPFTQYAGQYDVDQFVPGVQQGPINKQRSEELYSEKDTITNQKRSPFENIKRNEAITFGLAGVDAYLRKNQAIRDNYNYQKRLRNVFTQKPIYDYNNLYGPDSSGGTQYQSLIMAKDGAQIRKTASPNFGDVEVEGGEFIQLPDLTTQHVQGPSHAKGGVHTSLPEGSRVFSDFLKPVGGKKTYAQLAKKYDVEKWQKILDNPFANKADRRTAEITFKRNQSILNELFADQQIQNGNSDGTDQAAEAMGMPTQMSQQMPQGMSPEMMGKFGLDLKKGEKLSFTNPFEYGGEYVGGTAEFNYGGYYMDGGMFPQNSTFYGSTPGDTSVLPLGTNVFGKPYFQVGGQNNQSTQESKETSKPNPIDNATVKWYFDTMADEYGYAIVVDKATNKLYYGRKNGQEYDVQSFEVLTGQTKENDLNEKASIESREANPYYRATPVGFFTLTPGGTYQGEQSFDLKETRNPGKSVLAIHATYYGADDTNRASYYNNQNPEDNYASYGCINCRPPDLKNLIGFLDSQENKAQVIINSNKSIEENDKLFEKNKASWKYPGTDIAANLSVNRKALEAHSQEILQELLKDDYLDVEKLEKEIKNPKSPLNTDTTVKEAIIPAVEASAGKGLSLPKNAPEGTIAKEVHSQITSAANLPSDTDISKKYFENIKDIKPRGIAQPVSNEFSPVTSVNIPGPKQVENQAQAKLEAQSNAAIDQGAPSNTDGDTPLEWNWGDNYGQDVTTGFPPTGNVGLNTIPPFVNQDAITTSEDSGSPVTAPPVEGSNTPSAKLPYDEWRATQPRNISNPKLQRMYKEYSDEYDAAVAAGKTPAVVPTPAVNSAEVERAAQEGRSVEVPSTELAREQAETAQFVNKANEEQNQKIAEDENYGTKRIEKIKSTFSRDPKYKFRIEDLPQIKDELKVALKEWGIDSKENLEEVDKVTTLNGFTKVAEALQNEIYNKDPEMTVDYGINEAPTLQGLQHLAKLTDAELDSITGGNTALKTKIKSAQYGSRYNFSDDEIKSLSEGVKKLPEEKQKEYGKTNFMDKAWFYRRPIVKEVPFKNKEEFDEYSKKINIGGKYVGGEKTGLYIKPVYQGEEPKKDAGTTKTTDQVTETYPGSQFGVPSEFKQMPSTAGKFATYQAIPEALGYLSGLNPYTYFTPDYTHTEIVPPTLNIDDELQSINNTVQSAMRQTTGNPSIDNSRNAALFNTALQAKQQAFAKKQNYDANARFQADQYNAQARDLESFRDLQAASTTFNEYRAAALDAAERERNNAITSVVEKKAKHDADEFRKIMYFTTMYPNYYYQGTDRNQPIKFNPYGNNPFYSTTATGKPVKTQAPGVQNVPTAKAETPQLSTPFPGAFVPPKNSVNPSMPVVPVASGYQPNNDEVYIPEYEELPQTPETRKSRIRKI